MIINSTLCALLVFLHRLSLSSGQRGNNEKIIFAHPVVYILISVILIKNASWTLTLFTHVPFHRMILFLRGAFDLEQRIR